MPYLVKKILFVATFNASLFLILVLGIQNSNNRSKVDLLIDKTVSLPVGFIIGTSFISGSLFGNFLKLNFNKKEK